MSSHQCPICYMRERVSRGCPMCKGVGRISAEDLENYRGGEKHAEETLKTEDGKQWLDITVSNIGRRVP